MTDSIDDHALAILREIDKRADAKGKVELLSSEVPFALGAGKRWLHQVGGMVWQINGIGRKVLGKIT